MNIIWFFIGGSLGVFNTAAQWWTVNHIEPERPYRALAWFIGGMVLRWFLVASLLIMALQRGPVPALLAFAALWLVRWGMLCWLEFRV